MTEKENTLIPDGSQFKSYEEMSVDDVINWELKHYLKDLEDRDFNTVTRGKISLLKQIITQFYQYKDHLIYFNIHIDTNNYVDDDYEIWVEEKHILEAHLSTITPSLLAELERCFTDKWEIRTDRYGNMVMKFPLFERTYTKD